MTKMATTNQPATKTKKPRAPAVRTFLLPHHKMEIATKILEHKDILKGGEGLDAKTTNARKTEIWKSIYDHVTSMGAVIVNVHHLRKVRFFCSPKFLAKSSLDFQHMLLYI